MERRSFLKTAGVIVIAVSGGVVWRAYDTGVFTVARGPAFEPWDDWQSDGEQGPLSLVRSAILAANPFNTQPWLFRVGPSRIDVYADSTRSTGKFDPFFRELRIGLGCAIENLMLAAPAHGYRATLTVAPGTLTSPAARPARELVAQLALDAGSVQESELYRAIPHRHTNRYPYDPAVPIPAEFVVALQDLANDQQNLAIRCYTDDADRAQVVDMCTQAVLQDAGDVDARSGTARWGRDWAALQHLHDGTSIDEAGSPPLAVAAAKFFPPSWLARLSGPQPPDLATAVKGGYTARLNTGRLFGLIAVRDVYDQPQAVAAGRVWQRAHLLATARGLAARPVNQPVQLVDHQRMHGQPPRESAVLAQFTGDPLWLPTFMFMMGHPTRPANRSARRGVTEVVL